MNTKSLKPLTRLLTTLLKINIALLIIAVLGDLYSWYEYSHLAPNVNVSETMLPSDMVNVVIALSQLLLFIFLGITFLRWIHRVNKNLRALSSEPMIFTPGWSVGWYFIPIGNLYKPYQAMKEIWNIAHRGTLNNDSVLGWWWFLWIGSTILDRLSMKFGLRAADAMGHTTSAIIDTASDGVNLVLSIVALMLVGTVAKAYSSNYVEPTAEPIATPV